MSQARKILTGIALGLFLLVVLESFARVVLDLRDDFKKPDREWYVVSPALGWERRPNFHGKIGSYSREFDGAGYLTADTPRLQSHNPKVIAVGDSTTFGYGVPAPASFPQILDNALENVDVINLGVVGYSSHQGYQALQKYCQTIRLSAIIVSFNGHSLCISPSTPQPALNRPRLKAVFAGSMFLWL